MQDVLDVGADVGFGAAAAGAQDARDVGARGTLAGCSQAQQQVPPPNVCHHLARPHNTVTGMSQSIGAETEGRAVATRS